MQKPISYIELNWAAIECMDPKTKLQLEGAARRIMDLEMAVLRLCRNFTDPEFGLGPLDIEVIEHSRLVLEGKAPDIVIVDYEEET